VLELLCKASADGDVDFLREGARVLAEALMEAEVTELTGVPEGERAISSSTRRTSRSATPAGSCRWPRSSRSAWLATGERRILGLELAAGNDEGNAWAGFLHGLVERGLTGVRMVISDAHQGLVAAIRETLLGAAWQCCRVHFTRTARDLVPRGAAGMVASAIRSIFEQPDEHSASEQLRRVADGLTVRFPAVASLLLEAEPDLLVHFTFPEAHRRQIRSTNPQERLNKEIKRRTAVVGIFPTRASLIRLVGMVLFEQDDEWQDGRRYFRPESMARIDAVVEPEEVSPALLMRAETSGARMNLLLHHVLGLDQGKECASTLTPHESQCKTALGGVAMPARSAPGATLVAWHTNLFPDFGDRDERRTRGCW